MKQCEICDCDEKEASYIVRNDEGFMICESCLEDINDRLKILKKRLIKDMLRKNKLVTISSLF